MRKTERSADDERRYRGHLPGGYHLREEQGVLALRRPDGTAVAYFDPGRDIPGIVEEVVERIVDDTIENAGRDSKQ